jgi:gas vesicle protein
MNNGEAQTLKLGVREIAMILSLFGGLVGVYVTVQVGLAERPSREETHRIVEETIRPEVGLLSRDIRHLSEIVGELKEGIQEVNSELKNQRSERSEESSAPALRRLRRGLNKP